MSASHGTLSILALWLGAVLPAQATAGEVEQHLAAARWAEDEPGLGVTFRSAQLPDLFGAPQSLCVLVVELPRGERRLRFAAPAPFARVTVAEQARAADALAAVNGGFFVVADGTPLGLLKQDGRLRVPQDGERTVAIGVDRRERVALEARGPGDWRDVEHARGSWPLILRKGKPARPQGWGERDRRHPRTAAGLTAGGALVLLTVDGRTDRAAGMTLLELARTMRALGCETAMNLDGGGSTTMWLRPRGVVNHPCDNRRFDHAGARAVADVVLVFAPAVHRLDEDRAALTPAAAWQRREGEQCVGGDYALATGEQASAEFTLSLDRPGRFFVELRWPRDAGVTARSLLCEAAGAEPMRANPRRTPHRWVRLGTAELGAGQTKVRLRAADGGAFALDALRVVERPAGTR